MPGNALTERWTRLVVRPDALIRFWCIGGLRAGSAYAEASGSDVFAGATFTSHVFMSNGATHVRTDELEDLCERFMSAAREDPGVPQRLAKHYVAVGEEWAAHCRAELSDREALARLDDEQLAARLDDFCSRYSAYAPALYLPFPIERWYAVEFPQLLGRVSVDLRRNLCARVESDVRFADFAALGLIGVPAATEIERLIQPSIERIPQRTNAERKDAALNELGRALKAAFAPDALPTEPAQLAAAQPALAAQLEEVVREFSWIAQWGYPPRYRASTHADLLGEALVRARSSRSVAAELEGLSERAAQILDAADTSPRDRALIADFAYYNFYRTYRMELLIRAQYFSAPLLAEIGSRIGLDEDAWTHLTPDELREALLGRAAEREALGPLVERRKAGWMLETNGLAGTRTIVEGGVCAARAATFTAVLHAGENARSEVDASDPLAVGGKAAALAKLVGGGFRVPDFVVLTTHGVRALRDPRTGPAVRKTLAEAIDGIAGSGPLAVRSSASVEDGTQHSWAGRFTSVLGATPASLDSALDEVLASAHADRALSYAERFGTSASAIAMAVVVQRQVQAELAGVINTSVGAPGRAAAEIEIVRGLGQALVDGASTPARFVVEGDGTIERTGPDLDVPATLVRELAALAAQIERFFACPQDVEFAVRDGEIHVVQSRPLTGPAAHAAATADATVDDPDLVEVVTGLGGHVSARVEATVAKPSTPADGKQLGGDKVVVLRAATPIWDSVIYQAAALVTDEGGSTSHAIRVANELAIPAVVGTRTATSALGEDEEVVVDTTRAAGSGRVLRRRPE